MIQVSIDSNSKVLIPSEGKKIFTPNISLKPESVKKCLDFATQMAYGEGFHSPNSFGRVNYTRDNQEIFKNTLQGKIAEIAFYNFMSKLNVKPDIIPDFSVWGKGKWEDCDFTFNNGTVKVSIKSTKYFGNLLLLEKERYNLFGEYLEPADGLKPIKHDYIFLVRVKGVDSFKPEDYTESNENIEVEITGYLTNNEFKNLMLNNQMIRKGCIIGIPMIVDNYYICAKNLIHPEKFKDEKH